MNLVRLLKDLRFRLFYLLLSRTRVPLVTLGDECQWTFCDIGIGSGSLVLCAGAGHDISFEKALMTAYRCKVVLLDPSPTGIATVQRENIPPEQLHFMPVGLAGENGLLGFRDPRDPREGSFRDGQNQAGAVRLHCKSLLTTMSELRWTHIDLLKIDIEGFEYAVIQDLLRKRLDVLQLCVEFHYGLASGHTRQEMVRNILALRRAGYDLVHHRHQDHTFLRR
ncbi:MAG: hypothetical protein DME26_01395 [Verrucomicrobia bacterium]|nr:MAG: hypothetical protein DME26_01395 [Verrucomicrobiota bacterium]